jgi:O-antigen/teichoic acid export membrane protein
VFKKVRKLFADLTIYGSGDVATSVVSFLLLPVFSRLLSPVDYGIWALLLTVELVTKILFRWGVDASFMRLYYDCHDQQDRQRLASTIFFFLLAVNAGLLAFGVAAAPLVADHLFGVPGQSLLLQLVLVNTFIGGFYFIPFHVLRIQGKPGQFSLLAFLRSSSTLAARVLFVVVFRFGLFGVVLADIVVTLGFTVLLARWFAPLIRTVFSREILREALRFGLPRVPHGVAQQVIGPGTDAYLLRLFLPRAPGAVLGDIGVYSIGLTFGLGLKYFMSAFEYAWAPFYFKTMKEKDAKQTFSGMTTYTLAVLVLLAAGLAGTSADLLRLMTPPAYHGAARIIPWIAIGATLQGVYLLTSIGLNITKHTEYYPVATATAALVNVGANVLLIPRFGILGPAYANVLSYAVLAGMAMVFSQRLYPIRYEWGRLLRLVLAAIAACLTAMFAVPGMRVAAFGVLVRGTVVVGVYLGALAMSGFFNPRELERLRGLAGRLGWGRRERPQPAEVASEKEPAP